MKNVRRVRRKFVWSRRLQPLGLLLFVLLVQGCGELTREGRAASFLILEDLEGASGADPNTFANVLQSDVQTFGGIFEDPGRVTVRLALKDAGTPNSPSVPSSNNFITVTRYRVVFKRADGRNTPGVDVPHPFDGAISFTATLGSTEASFTLVRAQSKLEAPLLALRGIGGAGVISAIAEVTFYGHDQTGTPVSVIGTMSVNFADWADPETEA